MDEDGEWIADKNWLLGFEAYRERLRRRTSGEKPIWLDPLSAASIGWLSTMREVSGAPFTAGAMRTAS
jgi:hypothetical protein